MDKFAKSLIKGIDNNYITTGDDEQMTGNISGYLDTGSYALNAVLGGSIYRGAPSNRVVGFGGEEATGKTFYVLALVKQFLDENPDGVCVFMETESALSTEVLVERGIDAKRVLVIPVTTVQEFRSQAVRILKNHDELPDEDKRPIAFALDSLGNLSTSKEVDDMEKGEETRDMTRTQLIRGAFRVLTLRLGRMNIPLYLTNHTYQTMEMYSKPVFSGGGGAKYAASSIIILSKSKGRMTKSSTEDVVGTIMTATVYKGRLVREGTKVRTLLHFDKGLDRYFGLYDIAVEGGIFKKKAKGVELPDGSTAYEKDINKNPTKYYTKEVLDLIDEHVKATFQYHIGEEPEYEDAETGVDIEKEVEDE